MYKTNTVFIIFFIILVLSSLFFYISYFNNDSNKMYTSHYSYKGIKLIPQNAPRLSSLFESINKDPHKQYISSEACLKCHIIGQEIKGKVKAPQMAHNIQAYCISCHILAENDK